MFFGGKIDQTARGIGIPNQYLNSRDLTFRLFKGLLGPTCRPSVWIAFKSSYYALNSNLLEIAFDDLTRFIFILTKSTDKISRKIVVESNSNASSNIP